MKTSNSFDSFFARLVNLSRSTGYPHLVTDSELHVESYINGVSVPEEMARLIEEEESGEWPKESAPGSEGATRGMTKNREKMG